MLRSVLAAAFSTVVAIGALSGLAGTKGDVQADSTWRQKIVAADSTWVVVAAEKPLDSTWQTDDSTWAVES
ncbi:hypothetical protein EJC51_26285 [Streptomyces aquilus]|uniref:5'-nucleotidase n=1 Tax=Streptomyces aquilus TaxID=2548456 RepID=A0A3Q9BXZ9_9ACTN|nr:hypothetical protein [Streptomyces aquilus]AZP19269.1 hypothetical protein EJC51_26285 [Streptomyces aquilus]